MLTRRPPLLPVAADVEPLLAWVAASPARSLASTAATSGGPESRVATDVRSGMRKARLCG